MKDKSKQGNFLMLSNHLFEAQYSSLSTNAKWLFCVLSFCEHRYAMHVDDDTGDGYDWFFRSDELLSEDSKLSLSSVKRAKKELKQAGIIETNRTIFIHKDGSKSNNTVTGYRLKW